jgi:hypothetical protein
LSIFPARTGPSAFTGSPVNGETSRCGFLGGDGVGLADATGFARLGLPPRRKIPVMMMAAVATAADATITILRR